MKQEFNDLDFGKMYPNLGFELGSTSTPRGITAYSGATPGENTFPGSTFSGSMPEIVIKHMKDINGMNIVHFEKYVTIQVSPDARRICNFNNGSWRDYEWAIRVKGQWEMVKDSNIKRELEKTLWANKNYDIDVIIGEKNKNPLPTTYSLNLSKDPFIAEEELRVNKNLTIELDTANKKIKELENSLNKAYTDLNLTNVAVRQLTQENRKLEADLCDAKKLIQSKKSFISKIFNL